MNETQVKASTLADFVETVPGIVSLVGDHGAHVLITGEISNSNVMTGCIAIETEVGTLYIDGDETLTVIEK